MAELDATPSDTDTLAVAVSFWVAATALIEKDWADLQLPLAPIYTLLGFSVENGLKTLLQHRRHEPLRSWKHSHDLRSLRLMATEYGLSLSGRTSGLIDALSPYHASHMFRYPKQMPGSIPSLNKTLAACDDLLRSVGGLIDVSNRV